MIQTNLKQEHRMKQIHFKLDVYVIVDLYVSVGSYWKSTIVWHAFRYAPVTDIEFPTLQAKISKCPGINKEMKTLEFIDY